MNPALAYNTASRTCNTHNVMFNPFFGFTSWVIPKKLVVAKKNKEAKELFDTKKKEMKNLRNLLYKVKLYLSPEDIKHKELDEKLDEFTHVALEDFDNLDDSIKLVSLNEKLVSMTKSVLKEAWEDAKSTKFHEVLNFKK